MHSPLDTSHHGFAPWTAPGDFTLLDHRSEGRIPLSLPTFPFSNSWRPIVHRLDSATASALDPIQGLSRPWRPICRPRKYVSTAAASHTHSTGRLIAIQGSFQASLNTQGNVVERLHRDKAREILPYASNNSSYRQMDFPALINPIAPVRRLGAHRPGIVSLITANTYASNFIFTRSASDQFFND